MLFTSLFKGREDVFARRWEKWQGGVSGYSPVYTDQDKESYVPLTNDWVEKHLIGATTLGVYPLLKDNTSNFIRYFVTGGTSLRFTSIACINSSSLPS